MDIHENRERSFYSNNKIKVLQQGADNVNIELANYLGDSEVYIEKDEINVQVHKIVPKKKDVLYPEYTQYMFAIYMPKCCDYFVKG